MKGFWTETRWNGQPIEPGTVCWVTDLEDGTNPIYTYGANQGEVFEKLARQNANAQLALARRSTASIPTAYEAATGIDPVEEARRHYAVLAMEWENQTPEFYPHPGNRQLVGEKAIRMAGGKPGQVTKEILRAAFEQLYADGLLFERTGEPAINNNQTTLTALPGESQVQPPERPRGTRFATGASSLRFTAPQTVQTRALKYTEEQIRTMPERERRKVFDAPEYIRACEVYFSGARATA